MQLGGSMVFMYLKTRLLETSWYREDVGGFEAGSVAQEEVDVTENNCISETPSRNVVWSRWVDCVKFSLHQVW